MEKRKMQKSEFMSFNWTKSQKRVKILAEIVFL
jgi:hypothetical protein